MEDSNLVEDQFVGDSLEYDDFQPWGMDLRTFTILMHLSIFAGAIVPFGGIILPVVMWTTNKDKSVLIDQHGKNILNWMISSIIYVIGGAILVLIGIGVLILIAVAVCTVVFAILGAVKASNGEVYKYPLAIEFIK